MKTYLFDFAKDDFEQLRQYISDIDVGFVGECSRSLDFGDFLTSTFPVNSVGVGRENLERYGDNPEADRQILKVNGLGAAEVSCLEGFDHLAKERIPYVIYHYSSCPSFFRRWRNPEVARSLCSLLPRDIDQFHFWPPIRLLRYDRFLSPLHNEGNM